MYSSMVPVLPAAGSVKPRARAEYPVPWSSALRSIEVMTAAVSSESTSTGRGAFFSSTLPARSSTLRMRIGSLRMPRLAKTA